MPRPQTPFRSRNTRGLILGILCALLVVYASTVQAVHNHDGIGASHGDCALCLVVHAGVAPHAPVIAPVPAQRTEEIEIAAKQAPRNSFVFSFYSRPPPAEPASL